MKMIPLFQKSLVYIGLLIPYCLVVIISTEWGLVQQIRDVNSKEDGEFIAPTLHKKTVSAPKLHMKTVFTDFSNSNHKKRSHPSSVISASNTWRKEQTPGNHNRTTSKYVSLTDASVDISSQVALLERYRKLKECTCVGTADEFFCCQRAIIAIHKMGLTVLQQITDAFFPKSPGRGVDVPQIMIDHKYGQLFETVYRVPATRDYRHVVVTRNWYDAILSGYLYHKSGKECWLDWYGRPDHQGWLLNNHEEHWEGRLLHDNITMAQNSSWPAGNDRDLCQYLAEESEHDGLRVYTAWAMASFMFPLLDFRRRRLELEGEFGLNRTLFLCFEQFKTPSIAMSTMMTSVSPWFFPNRTSHEKAKPVTYLDGHASDQDPTLRRRLYEIISRIDDELFHGTIAQGSLEFGCGKARSSSSLKRTKV